MTCPEFSYLGCPRVLEPSLALSPRAVLRPDSRAKVPLSPREPMLPLESCVGIVLRSDPIAKAPLSPHEP
ncbi:unnamed protein product, partial [Staurois parvus]